MIETDPRSQHVNLLICYEICLLFRWFWFWYLKFWSLSLFFDSADSIIVLGTKRHLFPQQGAASIIFAGQVKVQILTQISSADHPTAQQKLIKEPFGTVSVHVDNFWIEVSCQSSGSEKHTFRLVDFIYKKAPEPAILTGKSNNSCRRRNYQKDPKRRIYSRSKSHEWQTQKPPASRFEDLQFGVATLF